MTDAFALRRADVVAEFDQAAQAVFRAFPKYRSAALAVAQYWADEADDAVHEIMLWSRSDAPSWPHECEYEPGTGDEDTVCSHCAPEWDWDSGPQLAWDDNGESIDLFAAFCLPECHQDMEPGEAYTPYAIARPDQPPEIVGRVLQPDWLAPPAPLAADEELAELLAAVYASPTEDLPRQVLADWLQDRDDPRGEFIARQLAGASTPGPAVDPFFPPAAVCRAIEYARGFPSRVVVEFADRRALVRHGGHPAWATVETVCFAGGLEVLTGAMTALRRVEGVSGQGVWDVARSAAPIAELQLRVDTFWAVNGLRPLGERVLERLELDFQPSAIRELSQLGHGEVDWRVRVRTAVVTVPAAGKRTLVQRLTGRRPVSPVPLLQRMIEADEWVVQRA